MRGCEDASFAASCAAKTEEPGAKASFASPIASDRVCEAEAAVSSRLQIQHPTICTYPSPFDKTYDCCYSFYCRIFNGEIEGV